jgi:hypothetical protein
MSEAKEHDFHELKTMTVAQLREIAAGIDHPAVKGYTQLRKAQVLAGICEALGLEMHEHHEVRGLDRAAARAKIREWKRKRQAALEAGDAAQLKFVRTKIRRLKRRIRKSMV